MSTTTRVFYRQPARAWTEALPLGNGRLGAMVWLSLIHISEPTRRS